MIVTNQQQQVDEFYSGLNDFPECEGYRLTVFSLSRQRTDGHRSHPRNHVLRRSTAGAIGRDCGDWRV